MFKSPWITLGSYAVVFALGGWSVNELWLGKNARNELKAKNAQIQGYEADIETANQKIDIFQTELENERAENLKLSNQLAGARAELGRRYVPIQNDIPQVIPQCDDAGGVVYDRGFVRVFNASATAGAKDTDKGDTEASPDAPR